MKNSKPFKLAYFVSHPIQYQVPLLRMLAQQPGIDLKVFFLSDLSVKSFQDKGFGVAVKWDVPLLGGYTLEFLPHLFDRSAFSLWEPVVYGIRGALKSVDWDAVCFSGYAHYALLWGIWCSVQLNIPYFFRAESNLICTSQGPIKDRFIRWLVKNASGLLWISSDNREYYKFYGASEDQLFFTPYAVANSFFQERSQKAKNRVPALKKELGLIDDIPVILYAGKFIKRKNPVLLLKAFARMSRNNNMSFPAYLLYVGDGEERPELERRIDELGLQDRAKLLGFKNQTELPDYFALCDLFVLPSHKEPFGLVINEVMNAGKAVISTNEVGASRDLVHDGLNGFVVPAGDMDALSHALKNALSDKKKLLQMGNESRKIIDKWSYQQDVDGLLKALCSSQTKKRL